MRMKFQYRFRNVTVGMLAALILSACAHAQENDAHPKESESTAVAGPACTTDSSPYRDLDFLPGHYDYFSGDGQKSGENSYSIRAGGCLILENWTSTKGDTGNGLLFVDPETGRWRHFWMSTLSHFDVLGEADSKGNLLFEGKMHLIGNGATMPLRATWTRASDGSIHHEYRVRDSDSGDWEIFFTGVSRRKTE